jgi:hypothetical protein
MIKDVIKSPLKTKRFRAIIVDKGNTKYIDFGSKNANTYIDGATDLQRKNYLKRHEANPLEKNLINNYSSITPSLLSSKLLWGNHKSITKNRNELNKRLPF